MKKFMLFAISLFVTLSLTPAVLFSMEMVARAEEVNIGAKSAVLIEENTGKILYDKSGSVRLYPASTTKIMTALLAIENADLNDVITVGNEIKLIPADASTAGLCVGEKVTLKELLMGMMLPSGNDAAMTAAVYTARKVSKNQSMNTDDAVKYFCSLMNKRASEAGATDTHFVNPHGYHDPDHYTTARDLALISREAMKNSTFREIVKTEEFKSIDKIVKDDSKSPSMVIHDWKNSNMLINPAFAEFYPNATGVKTGHTDEAGYCLVSSAVSDGMEIIAVVLDDTSKGIWPDSRGLLDYGFSNYEYYSPVKNGQAVGAIHIINSSPKGTEVLHGISDGDYTGLFEKSQENGIKADINWDSKIVKVSSDGAKLLSPVKKGEIIGKVVFLLNGKNIFETNVKAGEDMRIMTLFETASTSIQQTGIINVYSASIIVFIFLLGIVFIFLKAKKKRAR